MKTRKKKKKKKMLRRRRKRKRRRRRSDAVSDAMAHHNARPVRKRGDLERWPSRAGAGRAIRRTVRMSEGFAQSCTVSGA